MILEAFNDVCYRISLIRGPLWPDDGDDPPSLAIERDDGVIETTKGNFGCVDHLAQFFGCVVDYDSVRSIDSN